MLIPLYRRLLYTDIVLSGSRAASDPYCQSTCLCVCVPVCLSAKYLETTRFIGSCPMGHRCKKRFFTFFIPVTFLTFFNVFYFVNVFYFLKTFIENSINHQEVREALLKLQKRINRPRFYYESSWVQSSTVPITLGSTYSERHGCYGVMRIEYVKKQTE